MSKPNRGPQLSDKPNSAGFYEIRWSENGRSRRRSTGCANATDAVGVYHAFLTGFKGATKPAMGEVNVAACIASYWEEHITPKANGKDTAFYNLRNAATFFADFNGADFSVAQAPEYFEALALHPGGYKPSEITEDLVERFVRARRQGRVGRKATNGGIRRDLAVLSASLTRAARKGRIPPFVFPTDAIPEEPEPRDRWLTDAECKKLLAAADDGGERLSRAYRFVALALGTASRRAAIETLTREQVDLAAGVIRLNPKGRRQTNKRRPQVPIADWLRPILERTLKEIEGDYVLDHPGSIRTAFETVVARSGLEDVTPHALRHTWATRAAQAGVPLLDIAGVLGDSVKTVTNTYLHHCPEHLRGAVNHWNPQSP